MAASGVINAGMLGLQTARFEKLEVLDAQAGGYINVAFALKDLRQQVSNPPIAAAEEARLEAIEATLAS